MTDDQSASDTLTLDGGAHPDQIEGQWCLMEAVAYLAGVLVAGSRQSQSVQDAYGRARAHILGMAVEPRRWWDTCHGPDCSTDLARDDGLEDCSDSCGDRAAQAWHERTFAARGL